MKRILLISVLMCFLVPLMAQRKAPPGIKPALYRNTAHPHLLLHSEKGMPSATAQSPVVQNRPKSTNLMIDTSWIGSSINAYTLIFSMQRPLWYNKDLDAIMGTFRGNNSTTYPLLTYLTGNDVVNYFSTDQGLTFSKQQGASDGTRHRYPSGVIHNPAGNTDINNSYSVMEGPETDGSNWTYTYQVSVKHDGTDLDIQRTPVTSLAEFLACGMTATEDGKIHFCGDGYSGDYLHSTLMTRHGTFNAGNTIDWTDSDIVLDDLITKSSDGTLVTFFGEARMAWNNDGSVGYTFVRGSDIRPTDKPSWVPILFKTTDGGASWSQLDYFDFSTLAEITDWILPVAGDDNTYKPMFTDYSITVDNNDNPHIFALVRGAASKNVDSLTYIWTYKIGGVDHDADNNYVEVWIDQNGDWQAHHIDTVWADEVTETESNYTSSSGNVGWDHRPQASRSYDGTKIFCVWADSYYKFWGTDKYLFNPDLFVFGHNLNTGEMIYDTTQTVYSDVWGISFFHFVSPIAIQTYPADELYSYEIPVTVADITSTGNNADNPVYHIYVKGISMDFIEGVDNHTPNREVVSTLYPNPTTGTVCFDVTLDRSANVSAEVSNVTGQVVVTHDYGIQTTGSHKLALNSSGLTSGVYFCTFTVGNQKETKKMVVR